MSLKGVKNLHPGDIYTDLSPGVDNFRSMESTSQGVGLLMAVGEPSLGGIGSAYAKVQQQHNCNCATVVV